LGVPELTYVTGGQVEVDPNGGGGQIKNTTPVVLESVGCVVGLVVVGANGPSPVTVYGANTQSVTVIALRVMTVVYVCSITVTTGKLMVLVAWVHGGNWNVRG
jgi:hypothetical protein